MDDNPRTCPACGLPSARLRRLDHYLSLFFIPLFPVKRGEEFLECDRCGGVADLAARPPGGRRVAPAPERCPACGRETDPDFTFCPRCGQRLRASV